eukprot:5150777-Pyramimonas_sp.AAC.1
MLHQRDVTSEGCNTRGTLRRRDTTSEGCYIRGMSHQGDATSEGCYTRAVETEGCCIRAVETGSCFYVTNAGDLRPFVRCCAWPSAQPPRVCLHRKCRTMSLRFG